MKLTVFNLTNGPVVHSRYPNAVTSTTIDSTIPPHTWSPQEQSGSTFLLSGVSSYGEKSEKAFGSTALESEVVERHHLVILRGETRRSWYVAEVKEDCPWRVYCRQVSRHNQLAVILPRRDLASFLSDMPDSVPLSLLCLPGTHDTCALYGWPVSQCQDTSTPLPVQLMAGIRVIDIRLSLRDGRLIAYHGAYPQRTSFETILETLHAFLTGPKSSRETIVVSIKQEDFAFVHPRDFSRAVRAEIEASSGGMGMWFLDNRVPTLGEVRGRCVMFSRFGGDGAEWDGGLEGLGIHPTTWPDSAKEGFTYDIKNTMVRTHDWYAIPSFLSIPEKVELATNILLPPSNEPPMPILSITYLSAASFPFAAPPVIAKGFGFPSVGFGFEGVNARAGRWLLDRLVDGCREEDGPRIRGWVFMDYFLEPYEGGIVPLLVECNFRGREGA